MYEVKMPRLGATMEEGLISSWLIEEGDYIEKGDYLFELESEKTTVEVEAQNSGILKKILIPEGQEVPVNTVIAILAEEDEEIDLSAYIEKEEVAASISTEEKEAVSLAHTAAWNTNESGRVRVVPKARQLAKKLGVEVELVKGTGKDGLITVEDIENAAAVVTEQGAPIKVKETIPLNKIKKAMSEKMQASWNGIPHFTQIVSVNMSQVLKIKKELEGVSINDLIVKAVANAVSENSIVNSKLEENKVTIYEDVNVSVAIDSEQGLVVPVVKQADKKSVYAIAKEIKRLAEKAKSNQLQMEDNSGGTITVSNLGNLGIEAGTPIINSPQSTIIFAGAIQKTPYVNTHDEIVIAPIMKLSICYDHRFIDGVSGAKFTNGVKDFLENFSLSDVE